MIKDQRTDKERETSNYFVMGRDTFLSGWGEAENTYSYAVWFCETKEQHKVLKKWVKNRGEMVNIESGDALKFNNYVKTRFAHPNICKLHIYGTGRYHPAYEKTSYNLSGWFIGTKKK